MSQLNMAAMNGANGSMAALPLMNNGANGATPRPGGEPDEPEYDARLNAYIYDYFIRSGNFDCARAVFKSEVRLNPPLRGTDGDINGTDENTMHTDSKDDMGSKRPSDLPPPSVDGQGASFLLEWFSLFWDVYFAQRKKPTATTQAMQYVQQTQAQSRFRQEQQAQLLRNGMNNIMPGDYQMMRMQQNGMPMPDNLRAKAMANRGNAFAQATPQQLAQMKQQHLMQQQMRRDPSDMDVNGQRARTPSSGDNAPSPSKRQRMEGVPFNAQQMMQNNRGPMHNMQGQPMMDPAMNSNPTNQMLISNGIDPDQLSATQYQTFQQAVPAVQAKSIQVLNQNLPRNGRPGGPRPGMPGQGSPMVQHQYDLSTGVHEFMNNPAMMQRNIPPGTGTGGNHALQDYQMQLMLLEQQNKKRLLMARQEQDNVSRPDGQPMPGGPGFAPMSPSGSRSGPSPGPNEQMGKRSPKMGPTGLPGSPMPDGSMAQARGSPAAMSFNGQVPAEIYQMNGMGPAGPTGMRMPPSSHPGPIGGGGFNPAQPQQQQVEAMRAQANRMPNGQQWQQPPPPGQAPVMQPNQSQQPAQVGTPQQRNNAMLPPQGPPASTGANGARPNSPAPGAPPTPQPANKTNPKGKKDTKETRKRPNKKTSTASVSATPAGEQEAPPPTPATPITPQHRDSFAAGQKTDTSNQAALPQGPASVAPTPGLALQPEVNMVSQFNMEGTENQYNMAFSGLEGGDVLDNFDFDSFLHDDGGFEFDASHFSLPGGDGVEAGAEGA